MLCFHNERPQKPFEAWSENAYHTLLESRRRPHFTRYVLERQLRNWQGKQGRPDGNAHSPLSFDLRALCCANSTMWKGLNSQTTSSSSHACRDPKSFVREAVGPWS